MSVTPHLGLAYLEAAQAQKHVTVNAALGRLDAVVQATVLDLDRTSPPASPTEGDRHIVASGASGAWAGHDDAIAGFLDGAWIFMTPGEGWRVHVAAKGRSATYAAGRWRLADAHADGGASIAFHVLEELHDIAAGATSDTTIEIPDRAVVFGVTGKVTQAITGASNWDLGVAGATDRYGSGIGVALASTVNGISSAPVGYYAAIPLRLSANGGAFTGGQARLAIHYLALGLPD